MTIYGLKKLGPSLEEIENVNPSVLGDATTILLISNIGDMRERYEPCVIVELCLTLTSDQKWKTNSGYSGKSIMATRNLSFQS